MEATMTLGGVRHIGDGPVMIDRAWGKTLGAHQAKGAQRVGNFYRVPRVEYLRLVEAQAKLNPEDSPCFDWTPSDDQAVVELLDSSRKQAPSGCKSLPFQIGPPVNRGPFFVGMSSYTRKQGVAVNQSRRETTPQPMEHGSGW